LTLLSLPANQATHGHSGTNLFCRLYLGCLTKRVCHSFSPLHSRLLTLSTLPLVSLGPPVNPVIDPLRGTGCLESGVPQVYIHLTQFNRLKLGGVFWHVTISAAIHMSCKGEDIWGIYTSYMHRVRDRRIFGSVRCVYRTDSEHTGTVWTLQVGLVYLRPWSSLACWYFRDRNRSLYYSVLYILLYIWKYNTADSYHLYSDKTQ